MSQILKSKLPCPKCTSSDAYFEYTDGHGHCYSCNYTFQPKQKEYVREGNITLQYVADRGITRQTMESYNCLTRVSANGTPIEIIFPYGADFSIIRNCQQKKLYSKGDPHKSELFGMKKFPPSSSLAITITEGAYDALAVYQMLGSKYPAVSVRSSVTAFSDCQEVRDYLNSFDKIYLCFDSDSPGQKAMRAVASLFDPNKVFHVQFGKHTDPNAYLIEGVGAEFVKTWYNARPYIPKDIVVTWDQVDKILEAEDSPNIAEYPYKKLNEMTYGIRSSEIILVKAPRKVGKSEFLGSCQYHVLKNTDLPIGIIHLEEKEKRSVQRLVNYDLQIPVHLPDCGLSTKDVSRSFRDFTKVDGRCHFYSHFGSNDPNVILDVIRYLVSVRGCKIIYLDHLTMLVTGFEHEDERRKLDFISTRLAMMTRELDFTLIVVSHVNDDGKARGSRNIEMVADLIISLNRDIESSTDEQNKTYITIQGNRYAGRTGYAGVLQFNPATFTLTEMEIEDAHGASSDYKDSSIRDSEKGREQSPYPRGF